MYILFTVAHAIYFIALNNISLGQVYPVYPRFLYILSLKTCTSQSTYIFMVIDLSFEQCTSRGTECTYFNVH